MNFLLVENELENELDSTLRYGVYLISGIGLNLRNYKCTVNTRKKSSKLSPTGDQDACSSKLWFDVANRSLKSNYGLSYPAIPQRRFREVGLMSIRGILTKWCIQMQVLCY